MRDSRPRPCTHTSATALAARARSGWCIPAQSFQDRAAHLLQAVGRLASAQSRAAPSASTASLGCNPSLTRHRTCSSPPFSVQIQTYAFLAENAHGQRVGFADGSAKLKPTTEYLAQRGATYKLIINFHLPFQPTS